MFCPEMQVSETSMQGMPSGDGTLGSDLDKASWRNSQPQPHSTFRRHFHGGKERREIELCRG